MNFSYTEEQQLLIDSFNRFLDAEIKPIAHQYRDKYIDKELAVELQKKLIPFGIVNGFVSEADGGMGLDLVSYGLMMHDLAKASPDICITTQIMGITSKLMAGAPENIKSKYLPEMMAGDILGCVGMSEPSGGSDVASLQVKAKKAGDVYLINGEKTWISSGGYSDFILLLARFVEGDDDQGLGLIL